MLCSPAIGAAQSDRAAQANRLLETRASLEAERRAADSLKQTSLSAQISSRLRDGDFAQGDRIVVAVLNAPPPMSALPDTVTVADNRMVAFPRFPNFGDLSLAGVLRSELPERVTQHFARNLINPTIRVTALVRVGVLGTVARPGYYWVPPEAQLTDLITLAGGYTPESDPANIIVRRNTIVTRKADDVRAAMTAGLSVDRLHMSAGDEVFVGRKVPRSWLTILQVSLGLISVLVLTYVSLRRR